MPGRNNSFTYIIVGAGSAGCVLANRLSADPKNRVLLLEAGGRDINPWIHIPVGYFKSMHNPKTDWCYETESDPGLNDRSIQWPRGRVLGGSSSINGLLYIRGQAEDYDHWRQLGNTGWSFEDVLPYFLRSEDQRRGGDAFHATGGPLSVEDIRIRREICDAFIKGAVEIGVPETDDFNGADQQGAGYVQLTARNGRRCSAAVAYLHPVRRKRKNLKVVTHALAQRLLFDGNRATGLAYTVDGVPQEAHASGEVILSAGAIGSPQILQVSGVGAGADLRGADIPVRHELPGVGRNLQDHLQVRLIYRTRLPLTLNDQVRNPLRKMMMGVEYLVRRTGPLSMGASQICVFAKTRPELATPDIQFHIQPLSADKPGDGLHKFSAFTVSVCQLRPESRGRIVPKSSDPAAYPAIHPNYLATATDQETLIGGMRMSRQIAETKALSGYIADEMRPGPSLQTDDDLLTYARDNGVTIYHPVGTCKMGTDPMAVVDARLRVHGIERLRVVDASIMPTLVSGNTNAPAIMIGEKASDMILQDAH